MIYTLDIEKNDGDSEGGVESIIRFFIGIVGTLMDVIVPMTVCDSRLDIM